MAVWQAPHGPQQILSPNTRCVRGNTPCMRAKSIKECKKLMLGACGGQGRSRRRPGRARGAHCSVAVHMCWAFGRAGPTTGRYCSNPAETAPHARMTKLFMNMSMICCGRMGARGSRDGARARGGAPLLCGALMLGVSVWHAAALNPPPPEWIMKLLFSSTRRCTTCAHTKA